jgi:effector-binding domain-containing protein
MQVKAAIQPKGRVKAAVLPAGKAVVAWHLGPYEKLGDTHARIQAYCEEHGLEQRAAPWEEYWTDPGMEPDPSKWRTKIVMPVKERREQ